MSVHQFLSPKFVTRRLEEDRCKQFAFAELVGLSEPELSLFLSGRRGLSLATQQQAFAVLEFLEKFRDAHAGIPIDFSDVAAIRPHFEEFLLARAEGQVVRMASEMKVRAGDESK